MFDYSQRSLRRLEDTDPRLQSIFKEVIKHFDNTIVTGHRTKDYQERVFSEGKSKVHWPNSKHNSLPSRAVDAAPYPLDWSDRERFTLFAGFVLGIATSQGIKLRWGGDWDRDTQVKDNSFDDLLHFELVD